jgi:hypothetical protein
MTSHDRFPSVCVPSSPPVPAPTERFAPLCSRAAPRLFPALRAVRLPAARATVALPHRAVRLPDGIYSHVAAIGSSTQTR